MPWRPTSILDCPRRVEPCDPACLSWRDRPFEPLRDPWRDPTRFRVALRKPDLYEPAPYLPRETYPGPHPRTDAPVPTAPDSARRYGAPRIGDVRPPPPTDIRVVRLVAPRPTPTLALRAGIDLCA